MLTVVHIFQIDLQVNLALLANIALFTAIAIPVSFLNLKQVVVLISIMREAIINKMCEELNQEVFKPIVHQVIVHARHTAYTIVKLCLSYTCYCQA